LTGLPAFSDPDLLYGVNVGDDTGVYRLSEKVAIVQSVDFFTPIVDDPYLFGKIAAANSLSDIYTVGARPLTALNIVAFPCRHGVEPVAEILRGGADTVAEAGAVIIGGHSVEDDEPKYGLAVTGIVDPASIITNQGALPGDALILTKKIGVGILSNVARAREGALAGLRARGPEIPEASYREAEASMTRLNRAASETMREFGVRACTDVSGFGLLGHASNLAQGSHVKIVIGFAGVPLFPGIEPHAIDGTKGGGERNHAWLAAGRLAVAAGVTREQVMILCDPQTSGGLLMAAPEEAAEKLVARLRGGGDVAAAIIGHVEAGDAGTVEARP